MPEVQTAMKDYSQLDRRYRLLRHLGREVSGEIYEARDLELDRLVIIKIAGQDQPWGSFEREARHLGAMQHPGLRAIYSFGEQNGRPYVAMERLDSMSLAEHLELRVAPFRAEEVIEVLLGIAEALGALHGRAIVHGNLSPSSVQLTANGRIVLVDLAPEVLAAVGIGHKQDTLYAAPERVAGKIEAGGGRAADIYSLGAIGYELLAGFVPLAPGSLPYAARGKLRMGTDAISEAPLALSRLVSELVEEVPDERPISVELVSQWLRCIRAGSRCEERRDIDVLIADDDPEMRDILEACVRTAVVNVRIRTAVDGVEALAQFRERRPDLLLCDLHMPRLDGIDVCRLIRGTSLADQTSIIAVSARAGAADLEQLNKLGVHDFISKHNLTSHLLELLHRMQQSREHIFFGQPRLA